MAPIPRVTSTFSSTLSTTLSTISAFIRRQSGTVADPSNPIIPTTYGSINSGPPPGTVVGIVLGSVGGFLLLLWLIYTCIHLGQRSSASDYTESVIVRDRRKSHRGSSRTRSRRMSETVEIRRGPSPVRIVREPVPERVERVIVEEERVRRPPPPPAPGPGESDEVIVIEEHSPPRRKKSQRDREVRESRESGYRTVDPLAYGGTVGGARKSSSRRSSGR